MAKDKNKIKTYQAESDISIICMEKDIGYDCNYIALVWVNIHCESKIQKQDKQAGER